MGTINSRTKICKVTPNQEQPLHQTASPRMIIAGRYLPQNQQGILGHQQIRQLPPLKQHVPQLVPSPADSQNVYAESIHSIIKSHPPQKPKAWQAVACQMELPEASKSCDENNTKANHGRILQAQTLLIGQATKKRQSRQRHLREQRKIHTSSVAGGCNGQTEIIHLVSRPTQRDIFWDETTGQNLDLRELLQPSPQSTDPDSKIEELTRRANLELNGNSGGFSRGLNKSVTKSAERIAQRNLPWLEDFRKHERNHLNSWDILEDQWGHHQWPDESREHREKDGTIKGRNTTSQVNSVHQKWNSWERTNIT